MQSIGGVYIMIKFLGLRTPKHEMVKKVANLYVGFH